MQTILNIQDLLTYGPRCDNVEGAPVFRGQGKPLPLIPSLFREGHAALNFGSWSSYEKTLIRLFQREAEPHLDVNPTSLIEWIVLAQHHGLPSRCIDWTSSPLVALYFAVEDLDEKSDGVIWCYSPTEVVFKMRDTWNDLDNLERVLLHPLSTKFSRVLAQRACVTIHPVPKSTDAFTPFEQDNEYGLNPCLKRFVIPGEVKWNLMRDLSDAGFSRQHIYPGLDGLCADIRWRLRRLKKMNGDSAKQIISHKLL